MGKSSGDPKLKRRHHTVPRLLLRRFADGKRLLPVPLDGDAQRLVGIADVTVHNDFYSMRGENGQLDDSVESLLAELEGKSAAVIRKAVDDGVWPLPLEQRAVHAEWIAAQYARIPAARKASNEIGDYCGKIMTAMEGKPGIRRRLEAVATGPVSDEEVDAAWAELTDFDGYYAEMSVNGHMVSMGTPWRRRTRSSWLVHGVSSSSSAAPCSFRIIR
ncbi:DUF4238 domain-containing protein [Streptomyces sp. VRA16 Mangrove soil]|uniref:DUF4238 domain-containing protein n=1 Tax=Streptomyces sp. VRA16 Mangrove soil TaxID=2817434 RepID=UPI001A9D428A|nr:DUF4238 domain-containing protein [Streptomyces sp. VRA16 Mangrove soil]MBO1334390.1 DUF4238 domain-containing protein [Streptomyces sp. VRA16 Mangrove soil]